MGQIQKKKKIPRSLREFVIIYSNLGNGVNNTGVHREQGLVLWELVRINKSVGWNWDACGIVESFVDLLA